MLYDFGFSVSMVDSFLSVRKEQKREGKKWLSLQQSIWLLRLGVNLRTVMFDESSVRIFEMEWMR